MGKGAGFDVDLQSHSSGVTVPSPKAQEGGTVLCSRYPGLYYLY